MKGRLKTLKNVSDGLWLHIQSLRISPLCRPARHRHPRRGESVCRARHCARDRCRSDRHARCRAALDDLRHNASDRRWGCDQLSRGFRAAPHPRRQRRRSCRRPRRWRPVSHVNRRAHGDLLAAAQAAKENRMSNPILDLLRTSYGWDVEPSARPCRKAV